MSEVDPHQEFMSQALEQARKGLGRTFPNPCVGCVIVRAGEVVGMGFHERAGEPHAEVMALRSVAPEVPLEECTLYVTLEPCCMQGRTPACTGAIERAGIRRVVIGAVDPDPRVNGKGVARLREQGVEVITGVMREACEALIHPFAKRVLFGMPWVVAKWAMSLDGKIATRTGHASWITSEAARQRGHVLRDQCDAVVVGKGTALLDDPRLTCRLPEGGRDPWRVLIDARLEVGLEYTLLDPSTSEGRTVIVCGEGASEEAIAARRARGLTVVPVAVDARGRLEMEAVLRGLGGLGLTRVLIEGGGQILGALHDARLIDEVHVFVAPKLIGGEGAPGPMAGLGVEKMSEVERLEAVSVAVLEGGELHLQGEVPGSQRAHKICW